MLTPLLVGWTLLGWADPVDLSPQVREVFQKHCISCHGGATQKAGLRLDLKEGIIQGSSGGPILAVGKSGESEIIRRVKSTDAKTRMPFKSAPLNPQEIDLLARWIDTGAHWPKSQATKDNRLDHWAWQPIQELKPPQIQVTSPNGAVRSQHPIDQFIVSKLAQSSLSLSPQAERRTLIRRLSFDLLGLPPKPEEIEAFVLDPDPKAYEKLVDRYLASPHYGERWARHWLDIAHYADTHGFERDQRRDNAWRYRDWVIKALNDDLPYDRFLQDQIAGDVLRPNDSKAIIATGFLAAGPWDFVGQAETPSPVLKRQARADDLDDMVTQVITATCGVTINCARCHDHKIDPVSQREYYSLVSVFAGLKRGDREADPIESQKLAGEKQSLTQQITEIKKDLSQLEGQGLNLADIAGGGNGRGTGTKGTGIHLLNGNRQVEKTGMVSSGKANQFAKIPGGLVDGVVVVQGGKGKRVPISSTGLIADEVPTTTGNAWDAVRHGPVNEQKSTTIGDIDYLSTGHSLLGLHANAAITFNLSTFRKEMEVTQLRFRATIGYGGRPPSGEASADARVLLDGQTRFLVEGVGPKSGKIYVDIDLPESAQFLTLMATEGKDGNIGFDQIFFGDTSIRPAKAVALSETQKAKRDQWQKELIEKEKRFSQMRESTKVYAVTANPIPEIRIQKRGNPEQTGDLVEPASLSLVPGLVASLGNQQTSDTDRRKALANWITDPRNPLPPRVIVNRLWHHHFGTGIVDTPSDFGLNGGKPSHPELLDWLASQLGKNQKSLKAIHRLICTSETYKQQSISVNESARKTDSGNRLLWRQNPKRLDAESMRDAILATSGTLNPTMFGPGFRDFTYKEEYAPVYGYITADQPELWRRSIYRFIVRTTPQPFLTTMDCPNPASLTPARHVTTTALQSLALLNNDFLLRQSSHFASRLLKEAPQTDEARVDRAFALALGRKALPAEKAAALELAKKRGWDQLCRMLFNANEFVYVD